MLVYKIFRGNEYAAFMDTGQSAGAPIDVADGYIHLSTAGQVVETAAKHFAAEDGLWLLALESDALTPLEWEPSRGGDLFPHLYRPLDQTDVVWAAALPLVGGIHDFSELL